jgi:hypothetical protein
VFAIARTPTGILDYNRPLPHDLQHCGCGSRD